MNFHHISVLYHESIIGLKIKEEGIYVDATLGGGGHSAGICEQLSDRGTLIGIDQDINAINAAKSRLELYKNRCMLVHNNFSNIKDILKQLEIPSIDGVVMDLGVSSHQLDTATRGFSYQKDAPLDMRMDTTQDFSAYQLINEYSENDIANIIYTFGEERWAKRIAKFIIDARKDAPIETTGELVEIIKKAIPASARKDGPHPAKRTFQAIRIEVNKELDILENAIRDFADSLSPGGRMAVITFHSLEDRIVKKTFNALKLGCKCPPQFPICVCGEKPAVKVITRKPILPSGEELQKNPRARSSKLRIIEKL